MANQDNIEAKLEDKEIQDLGESIRQGRMYGAGLAALVFGAILGVIAATGDYQHTEWYRVVGGAGGGIAAVGGVLGTIEYLARTYVDPKKE